MKSPPSSRRLRLPRPGLLARCAALAFLPLSACGDRTPTQAGSPPQLVVHAMLAAGVAEQTVLVEQARRLDDGFFFGVTPSEGAEVVVAGDGEHRFAADPAQPGLYRAAFTPRAGARYTLRVRGAQGQQVTGETVVPEPVGMRLPARDTVTAPGDTVELHWSRSPSAAGYLLLYRRPERTGPAGPAEIFQSATPFVSPDTTTAVEVRSMGVLLGLADSLRFSVAAVDENFRAYTLSEDQAGTDGRRSRFRTTVQGGYGLFGACALSDSRLVGTR